jgi:hypothetical protein
MPFGSTHELLESILEGNILDESAIKAVVAEHSKEDQHLDYKDAQLLTRNPNRAKKDIRQYISGFANAEGGVLVVGVTEKDATTGRRTIDGCARPGGKELDIWAKDLILDMASYLSPPPRFQVVNVEGKEVLVCGVARAPLLVPCIEEGRLRYSIRIHDSTVWCPDYLISGLVLGRRNHPVLELSVAGLRLLGHEGTPSSSGEEVPTLLLDLDVRVENLSLVPAPSVRVGVVSWGFGSRLQSRMLEYYIEKEVPEDPDGFQRVRWELMHSMRFVATKTSREVMDIPPFSVAYGKVVRALSTPSSPRLDPVHYAAAYVLNEGSPPVWYQLKCTRGINAGDDSRTSELNARRCTRLSLSQRPRVTWKRIGNLDE